MIQRSHSIALSLLSACVVLQGCQSVKRNLGIERDPPNEYVVTPSSQPLEMPPNFSCLPIPVPGMERPQERAARQTQEEKFLGASGVKESSSPGQEALLDMCGVQENQEDIRYDVDTEARMEDTKDRPIIEKLGIKKTKPKGEAINPYEESEALKKQGILENPSTHWEVMPASGKGQTAREEGLFSSLPPLDN